MSGIATGYIIAGLLALIGGAVRQYLAYRDGRKTEKVIQQNAVLKATLDFNKKANEIEAKPANDSFDSLVDRL